MTNKRTETTIRERQLKFAGAPVRQDNTRLPKRIMFGRLATEGPKDADQPSTHWGNHFRRTSVRFSMLCVRKNAGVDLSTV